MSRAILLVCCAFACVPAPLFAVSNDIDAVYAKGQEAYKNKDFLEAAIHLTAYLYLTPDSAHVFPEFRAQVEKAIVESKEYVRSVDRVRNTLKTQLDECREYGSKVSGLSIPAQNIPGAPPRASMPDREEWLKKFEGHYSGIHDGRKAHLDIRRKGKNGLSLKLTDVNRNTSFTGTHQYAPAGSAYAHILRDVILRESGEGGSSKHFKLLLLDTWGDQSRLTGISLWGGREFGATFTRDN